MAIKLTPKSAIAAGGISAVAIGALAMSMAMGPASAEDVNATPTTGASDAPFTHDESAEHGPMGEGMMGEGGQGGMGGRHGGMEGGMGQHGPAAAVDGTVILRDETFKADDGTITILRHQMGTVTAVSDSSITVKTGSVSKTYVINADTTGAADVAVDDQVGLQAIVDGNTATALDIHEMMAPSADGDHAEGMGGGHGRGGHHGPGALGADYGTPVSSETLVEKADGTVVTVRDYRGTVVSVAGNKLTVALADGTEKTFTVPASVTPERDRAAATLADFAAGDEVHVDVTVSGGDETVVAVGGHAPHGDFNPDSNSDGNA